MSASTLKKTNKVKRKKRISKHIRDSKVSKTVGTESAIGSETELDTLKSPAVQSKEAKSKRVKDPREASSYLSLWKHDREGAWKYNKNTQSWLLRHMYEPELVSKCTFELLTEYINGLQGEHTLHRLIKDAKFRALRYKDYLKSNHQQEDQTDETSKETTSENLKKTSSSEEKCFLNDDKKWKEMDDRAKRREYKRARKVVELLQSKL